MNCPKCNTENRDEAKFCKKCGHKIEIAPTVAVAESHKDTMICPDCGIVLENDVKFCHNCGHRFVPQQPYQAPQQQQRPYQFPQQQQPYQVPNIIINNTATANATAAGYGVSHKNKLVTLLLCLFGGPLGLHCFYVGKIGTGLIYILTFGLFFVGWIIDILKIISGTYTDGAGLPIRK